MKSIILSVVWAFITIKKKLVLIPLAAAVVDITKLNDVAGLPAAETDTAKVWY